MTIHNLKFQGMWDAKKVRDITGLPEYYFVPDKLTSYDDANMLKGGIVYADKVTTVSSSYAEKLRLVLRRKAGRADAGQVGKAFPVL